MSPGSNGNHTEAWKAFLDFTKSTTAIASTVLVAVVGYYVLNRSQFAGAWINYLPIMLLVGAIVVSMFGFGRGIRAISKGTTERSGILFANFSVLLLVLGILSIWFVRIESRDSLDTILGRIEDESRSLHVVLRPDLVQRVIATDSSYQVTYLSDGGQIVVTYSDEEDRIVRIE